MGLGALSSSNLLFTRMWCGVGCDVQKRILVSSPEGGSNLWLVDVVRALLTAEWVITLFVSGVRIFQVNLYPVFSTTPTQYLSSHWMQKRKHDLANFVNLVVDRLTKVEMEKERNIRNLAK